MFREPVKRHYLGLNKEFRFRGEEPSRIENFSDAVFALAITLLLISTSPPRTFADIEKFTLELIPFGLCITLIMLVWYQHFIFFFRYGFRSTQIIFWNTALLFIILFYVYPLKFLTRMLCLPIFYFVSGNREFIDEVTTMIPATEVDELMTIYGLGAAGLFLVLARMFHIALRRSDALELNEVERFDTRMSMTSNLLLASVPLLSALLALLLGSHWWTGMVSGFTYFLYTPLMFWYGTRSDKKRKALLARQGHSSPSMDPDPI
jgi:uncharacterized membrane protein